MEQVLTSLEMQGGKERRSDLEIRHPGLHLEHILHGVHNRPFPALVLLYPENFARITRLESRKHLSWAGSARRSREPLPDLGHPLGELRDHLGP